MMHEWHDTQMVHMLCTSGVTCDTMSWSKGKHISQNPGIVHTLMYLVNFIHTSTESSTETIVDLLQFCSCGSHSDNPWFTALAALCNNVITRKLCHQPFLLITCSQVCVSNSCKTSELIQAGMKWFLEMWCLIEKILDVKLGLQINQTNHVK